jgi:SAM-dependent methyltransferase
LAVDIAPAAIDIARSRGLGGPAPVTFSVGDVFEPTSICPLSSVDCLLDSAVFHCIGDDEEQRAYVRAITSLVKPGGRLVLFVFSDENDATTWRGPRCIPPAHARALWEEGGWAINSLTTDHYYKDTMGRNAGKGGHALLMTATRAI